ncbi:serine hydrolase [Pseudomarimonas arenosa]|uniref:Serine hydrolase n=1 Tax=Pseudomarimonas arenosa TaxID=2774145 RepID=A0AAW3ZM58_9GAMM|nr:serine hydrolase [Pseudomarimonas arenosa]MBD8527146.1 serine hydrolase [Pseudomarimonas arenosa]
MTRPFSGARAFTLSLGALLWMNQAAFAAADLESWINTQHAQGKIAAASVAEIDGRQVAFKAFGAIDGAKGAAPDRDTQFQIGSISKVFTNLLLAEAVADGKVRYESTIASLLPPTWKPSNTAVATITLESLATHHSGLPRLPANLSLANSADPYAGYGETELYQGVATARAKQPLGRFYTYSNFGVGLLGHLLGRAIGDGYHAAVEQSVLKPMGMQRTAFVGDANAAMAFSGGTQVPAWGFEDALAGAGALWGSVSDLARLVQCYLGSHPHQLKHVLDADLHITGPADAFEITRVWHVARAAGQPVFWHNGGTAGFHSFVGFRPDNGRGVAILISGDADPTNVGLAALGVAPIEPPSEAVDQSVFGQYQLNQQFGIGVFVEQGVLVAQATGQPAFGLHPVDKDWYAFGEVDAALHFLREAGAVIGLELVQNGVVQRAERSAELAVSQAKQEVAVERSVLESFVGAFDFAPGATLSVKLGAEGLMAQLTGQPAFPVFARGEDRFFYKIVDAELQFERDGAGKVVAVVLHQGGIVQRAARAK